jgi:exosortase
MSKPAAKPPEHLRWAAAGACALAGVAVFQFFGNASFGYIKSASLFWWWGYQWVNPQSETEHGLMILALSGWLVWRNLRQTEMGDGRWKMEAEMRGTAGTKLEDGKGQKDGGLNHLPSAISHLRASRAWPAFAAMAGGLALHVVGFAAQQARLSVVALLLFAWGVVRLGGGRRWGAAAMFPLAFMVLAIPFNALDSAGFWLRLWVIKASAALAHAAGIGVFQNGTQLVAPDGRYNYDVAAACSGVRSLMALLALSLLLGYLNFRSWWRRGVLVLLCFPLIYVGNVARIASIVFVAHLAGQAWGERAHEVMGYGVFVIVLGGELIAASAIRRAWPEAPRAEMGDGRSEMGTDQQMDSPQLPSSISHLRESRTWLAAAVIVVLAVSEMLFLGRLAALPPRGEVGVRLAEDGINPAELPAFLGLDWIGRRTEVTAAEHAVLPSDTGYSRRDYVNIPNPQQQVFLSIVLSGRDRSSIHRPELCVVGQGWTIRGVTQHLFSPAIPATVLHVQRVVQTPRGPVLVPQLIAYWFVGGDTVEPTYWKRLLRDAWNRVVHARADRWAYVLMQTDSRDGDAAALARMQLVLDQTRPVFARDAAPGGVTSDK